MQSGFFGSYANILAKEKPLIPDARLNIRLLAKLGFLLAYAGKAFAPLEDSRFFCEKPLIRELPALNGFAEIYLLCKKSIMNIKR
jgi:hypothetical protein